MGAITDLQRSLIVGTLLGDGAMRCKRNALLEVNHCAAQRVYVDWKYEVLQSLVATAPKLRRNNSGREAYRFTTRSLPVLTPFYDAFYASERKQVPPLNLTPLALAVWFMDDGSKSRRAVYLNTQQFDIPSQDRLAGMLWRQWGIACTLNRDKCYYRIRVRVSSARRFASIIAPHILEYFRYKLPA